MEKRYHYITPNDYETAEQNGINYVALSQRVRDYGWDIDRAITEPLKVGVPFQPVWEQWEKIATENGISKDLFYQRIKVNKWDEKRAATHSLMAGKHLRIGWTKEEREIAERNGLSANHMNLVITRINKLGWSKERALNTPKISLKEQAKRIAEGTRKYHRERGVNSESNKTV
ncbi:hypothetical protein [Sporosarcina sp. FSL K6-1508]|uniref:hypothetical protein n=1 Tax=Sporosarcina sp. FSL K6-1508 TaxID=2921553 RepID=UPI0030F9D40E